MYTITYIIITVECVWSLNIEGGFSLPKLIPFISLSVLYRLGFVAMGYKDHEVGGG